MTKRGQITPNNGGNAFVAQLRGNRDRPDNADHVDVAEDVQPHCVAEHHFVGGSRSDAVHAGDGFRRHGTLSYALSGGTLPTGLNFSNAAGQITGTLSTDRPDHSNPADFVQDIQPHRQPVWNTTQAVPSTTLTGPSAATPVADSGGTGTLSCAPSAGTLPIGLKFSTTTGQITGTPSTTPTSVAFQTHLHFGR
jgi:hypothetical protein